MLFETVPLRRMGCPDDVWHVSDARRKKERDQTASAFQHYSDSFSRMSTGVLEASIYNPVSKNIGVLCKNVHKKGYTVYM